MESIKVRKMEKQHLPAAISILSQWNMAPQKASAGRPDPERDSLSLQNTFVALDGSRVVGVCSYLVLSEEEAETASLAVDSDYRGRGVGYALQVARLKEIKERGFLRVHTETDRPETVEWYKRKFGYQEVGQNRKKHSFSLENEDYWTVLKLDLRDVKLPE